MIPTWNEISFSRRNLLARQSKGDTRTDGERYVQYAFIIPTARLISNETPLIHSNWGLTVGQTPNSRNPVGVPREVGVSPQVKTPPDNLEQILFLT